MPNPSSLLLLAEKMALFAEELIDDIRVGTVNAKFAPGRTPRRTWTVAAANPRRAEELATVLRRSGRLLPRDVWPNLRVISCWKGGTMPLYLRRAARAVRRRADPRPGVHGERRRGATPLVNSGAAGVLSITSHFFEFVPGADATSRMRSFLTARPARVEQRVLHLLHDLGWTVPLRHQRRRARGRLLPQHAGHPVRAQGQGMSSITGEKLTESQVTGWRCWRRWSRASDGGTLRRMLSTWWS